MSPTGVTLSPESTGRLPRGKVFTQILHMPVLRGAMAGWTVAEAKKGFERRLLSGCQLNNMMALLSDVQEWRFIRCSIGTCPTAQSQGAAGRASRGIPAPLIQGRSLSVCQTVGAEAQLRRYYLEHQKRAEKMIIQLCGHLAASVVFFHTNLA